jgi:4-amino-4-deoxy-L-arabinose transferase-like glycosyltransferase
VVTVKWFLFWLVTLFIKVFCSLVLPLSADECYYWVWSKHLQASYFDHPPMVAYWFALAEWLGLNGYGVRLIGVFLGHIGLWFWVRLFQAERTTPEHVSFWLLLLAHPLTGLGSIIMTPDAPLMFFAAASAWWLKKGADSYVVDKRSSQELGKSLALFYFVLGLLLGLGFLSKYHMVIWGLGLVVWSLAKWRVLFFRQLFWQAGMLWGLLGFFLGSAPVWWWNFQNDWVSFRFQLIHGLGAGNTPWWETVSLYIVGQILLMHPVTWWYVLKGYRTLLFGKLFRTLPDIYRAKFVWLAAQLMSFPFFLVTSFRKHVEANWTGLAFPAWLYLSSQVMPPRVARGVALFWLGIVVLVASHWVTPWAHFLPDKFSEVHQKRVFIEQIKKTDCPLIFTTSYQKASLLYFYTQVPTYKLSGVGRKDQFDLWAFDKHQHDEFCSLFPVDQIEKWRSRWPKHIVVTRSAMLDLTGNSWELLKWKHVP